MTIDQNTQEANSQSQISQEFLYIIEDDYALRDALEDYYSQLGYDVSVFSDGQEFLEQSPQVLSGVVISDLRMPNKTGLEVLRELQTEKEFPPFILMTAYGDIPSAVEAMNLGAYDFIEKPFDPKQLEVKIREAFNQKKIDTSLVSLDEKKRLREYVANFERSLLIQALKECDGHVGKVCDLLKVPRRTLNEKLLKYEIKRSEFVSE